MLPQTPVARKPRRIVISPPSSRKSSPRKSAPRKSPPRKSPRKSPPRKSAPRKSAPRKSAPRKSPPRKFDFQALPDDIQDMITSWREYGKMTEDIIRRWNTYPLDSVYIPDNFFASLPYRERMKELHLKLYGKPLDFRRDFKVTGVGASLATVWANFHP